MICLVVFNFWGTVTFPAWSGCMERVESSVDRKIFLDEAFCECSKELMTALVNVSPSLYPWSKDLEESCDVNLREKPSFAMVLGWLEKFVCSKGMCPGRPACERFWREGVMVRHREAWQIEQWGAAIRWYLRWLENRKAAEGEVRGLAQRVRDAVSRAGARRGLAPRTRETYGRWVVSFAEWVGEDRAMMNPAKGRDFLIWQVEERKVSYSTQKQALNSLVFFYKAVCGMEAVDLEVRLRKTEQRRGG
jgi:hypothetical protein